MASLHRIICRLFITGTEGKYDKTGKKQAIRYFFLSFFMDSEIDRLLRLMHSRKPPNRKISGAACIEAIRKKHGDRFPHTTDWASVSAQAQELLNSLDNVGGATQVSSQKNEQPIRVKTLHSSRGTSKHSDLKNRNVASSSESESDLDSSSVESEGSHSTSEASSNSDSDDSSNNGSNSASSETESDLSDYPSTTSNEDLLRPPAERQQKKQKKMQDTTCVSTVELKKFLKSLHMQCPPYTEDDTEFRRQLLAVFKKHGLDPNDLSKRARMRYEAKKDLEILKQGCDMNLDRRQRKGRAESLNMTKKNRDDLCDE